MKILLTAGATREPIDSVRYLSNISTGATGAALAEALQARGHEICLLHGAGAVLPRGVRRIEAFSTAADLEARLRRHLATGAWDAVIMAAAVADYRPERAHAGKLPSDSAHLSLNLVRNEKILPKLKSFAKHPVLVLGFKLTSDAGDEVRRKAVGAQFEAGGVDAVVHNDLGEISDGPVHPFHLYVGSAATVPQDIQGPEALAEVFDRILSRKLAGTA